MVEIKDLLGDAYHEGMTDEEIQQAFDAKYVGRSTHEKALQKQKGIIDSYSSQIAEAKKKERERMTEEEAKALAAQEQADKIADLEKQLKLRDTTSKYLARGFSPADAESIATALMDGDSDAVLRSIEKREAELRSAREKEYQVNPPAGNAGATADYSSQFGEAAESGDLAAMASLIRQQYEATHK